MNKNTGLQSFVSMCQTLELSTPCFAGAAYSDYGFLW